jgi:hypothetical protein
MKREKKFDTITLFVVMCIFKKLYEDLSNQKTSYDNKRSFVINSLEISSF